MARTTQIDFTPALEGLSERQRVFVEARLCGLGIRASAVAAGVTLNTGRYLSHSPAVIAALAKGHAISAAATGITRDNVTSMLMDAYRAAVTATEIVFAARELAKLHGLYAPQQRQIDQSHRVAGVKPEKDLKFLSVEDLERLVKLNPGRILEGEYGMDPQICHAFVT